jgi:hypothetical protein
MRRVPVVLFALAIGCDDRSAAPSPAQGTAAASASAAPAPPPASPIPGVAGDVFDPVQRGPVRLVLWGSPARVCESTDALDSLRCSDLPPEVRRPKERWQRSAAFPDHMAGAPLHALAPPGALRRMDRGDVVVKEDFFDAAAIDGDGGVVWVKSQGVEPDFSVWRKAPGGEPEVAIKSLGRGGGVFERRHGDDGRSMSAYYPTLIAPWLLFTAKDGIRAQRVLPVKQPIEEAVLALPVAADAFPPRWHAACETDKGLTIVTTDGDHAVVLFERGGTWSHVVSGDGRITVDPDPVDRPAHVDCHGDEVSLSWVVRVRPTTEVEVVDHVLRRIRCTPRACDLWESPPFPLPGSGPVRRTTQGGLGSPYVDAQLAVLGERLLLLWSTRNDVRMRVAAPADIASAADTVLVTGERRVDIETRRGVALVLVRLGDEGRPDTTASFRVDASGTIRPIPLAR